MGENYLNNFNYNKPNLVDYSILQKINQGYVLVPPPTTNPFSSLVQKAGNSTYNIIKDNLFISMVIFLLIVYLGWCYIEKKRQDNFTQKFLQKQYLKMLLDEEIKLFTKEPEPININELFNEINNSMTNENINLNEQLTNTTEYKNKDKLIKKKEYSVEDKNQLNLDLEISNLPRMPTITTIENLNNIPTMNNPMNNINFRPLKENLAPPPINGANNYGKYMDISNFSNSSYMLL